jgi:4-hydroxybenzoate polyprenyltransferase
MTLNNLLTEMRPGQWTKNIIVFAALFFAIGDQNQQINTAMYINALLACGLFSITASGVYIMNDILDIQRDKQHPLKQYRPLAAGKISMSAASVFAAVFLAAGLTGASLLSLSLFIILLCYTILQFVYTVFLKHIATLDVLIIAVGFVLRAVAGGIAINVVISQWLLICTFLLALFLALCKRRYEKALFNEEKFHKSRPSLNMSNLQLLDQLIVIIAGSVIVTYAIYTQWPQTVTKFGTSYLSLTIPFVVFGLFRYLDLVYRHKKGERPEAILLTDIPLIINILLFGITAFIIMNIQVFSLY